MAKQKTISLKQAKKVFPNEVTRLRPHDLIRISVDKKKFLTKKEETTIHNLADELRSGLFGGKGDLLVTRKRKKLKFVPF